MNDRVVDRAAAHATPAELSIRDLASETSS
jgi:hypothetical protein